MIDIEKEQKTGTIIKLKNRINFLFRLRIRKSPQIRIRIKHHNDFLL